MNFSNLYSELSDRLGVYDSTVAPDLVKLKRWINMGQQYICGKRLWPFMLSEEIVQTIIDITTGTVSINAGDTALTFSSAPTVSVQDRYIQLETSNDWYKITSHTASTTAATISPAYVGSSNLMAGTYTVRKLLYTTTTPLCQIIDMKQMVTPTLIQSISPLIADFYMPLYYSSGTVYNYIMSSPNSSGTPQFSLFNSPDTVLNVMVRGIKALADLSADSDIPLIPVQWQDGIINIAAFYGFQSIDDTRARLELELGEKRIMDMSNTLYHDAGRHRVMRSVDSDYDYGLVWAMPSEFGPWTS